MDAKSLIKSCIEASADNDKQKHLIFRKLGIKYDLEKTPHTFITCQFHEKEIEDREKKINATSLLMNYKWMKNNDYIYTWETYSKEYPEGGNTHLHILIKQTGQILNKSKILRDIQNKLKPMIKTCNYLSSSSKEHFLSRENYLKGAKSNEYKTKFCELDARWRDKNKISHYYTNAETT